MPQMTDFLATHSPFSDQPAGVVAIDIDGGETTTVSSEEVGGGADLSSPHHIVVDADGERALVHGEHLEEMGLVAVDLESGDRTSIHAEDRFGAVLDMALVADGDRVLLVEGGGTFAAIDPPTVPPNSGSMDSSAYRVRSPGGPTQTRSFSSR